MSKISDRRKIHSAFPPNTTQQQPEILRVQQTGISNFNFQVVPSIEETKKIMKQMQIMLKEEKNKRIEAEQNLKHYQQRTMMRQKQFYSILQENHRQVRAFKNIQGSQAAQQIRKVYDDIFENFQSTNQATNSMIEKKYKQNIDTMERRIENIMDVFKDEMNRTKRVSSQNFEQIKNEIEKALILVKSIESENVSLRINLKQQKYKNRMMDEQRKLLIDQAVNKKFTMLRLANENKRLKSQISILVQRLEAKQKDQFQNSSQLSRLSGDDKKLTKDGPKKLKTSQGVLQLQAKQSQITSNFFKNEVNTEEVPTRNQSASANRPSKSRVSSIASNQNSRANIKYKKVLKSSLLSSSHNHYITSNKNNINYTNSKQTAKFSMNKSVSVLEDGKCLLTAAKNDFTRQNLDSIDKVSQSNQKTIQHLKICLERQKRKVAELGKIITRAQSKNQQVNNAILDALSYIRHQNELSLQQGEKQQKKCEKLIEIIADMKKRLVMCQKPTIQCGWGQLDIDSLLSDQK